MNIFNEGDTACLMLNYNLNGSSLVEGAYQEIEFQINPQGSKLSIKKLLSKGEIEWATVTYEEDNETQTFTGYVVYLSQEDTFKLMNGKARCQLRIMVNDEVGSSAISRLNIGDSLSCEVLR